MTLKQQITSEALGIGFGAVGIARWDAALAEQTRLEKWLANGYGGDMAYLARKPESRCDPRSLLPECNSVIVSALNYYPEAQPPADNGSGQVSRYAWGADYHDVVKPKLTALGEYISSLVPGTKWKPTVDTSPILEKAFAVASGVGWRGKHSLVINKQLGSYFFIGLLLTSLELEPDVPVADGCEGCKLCLDACPTSALTAPRVLAANKCVSYLTTERKEPPKQGESTHGWLYGCDLCQEPCPYNADLSASTEPRFIPKPAQMKLTAAEILAMDENHFSDRFSGTVIKRRKLWRMQEQAKRVMDS